MRVTNLILHIITVILLLPDEVFVGLNTLVGLAYLRGYERIVVPMAAMIFCVAFFASTVGAIMTFASYKKMSPRVYKARELIIHGISAACFVMAIIYLIEISLHSSRTGSAFSRIINLAGIVVCIAGIIVTLLGSKSRKKRTDLNT